MFAVRGIAVCLAAFTLIYLALSLLVSWLPGRVSRSRYAIPSRHANLLFALRISPLAMSAAITLGLAAPSFLWLEPRSIEEPLRLIPSALGLFGLLLLLAGTANAVRAMWKASKTVAIWQSAARLEHSDPVPVLRTSQRSPALVAAGILRPRILLSHHTEFVLTPKELQTALQHELAHVRRRDNLKKLFMCFAAFPGMARLEAAWREASEMAADDAAVYSASEALDLAAALIKMSRLGPLEPPAQLTTALVHSPAASVNARVERLIAWERIRPAEAALWSRRYSVTAIVVLVFTLVLTYSQLLIGVHSATEWLVR
jgi:beta-lactamase regulating signal transducer with metallopeptidase domain